jgi:hypothetical protein
MKRRHRGTGLHYQRFGRNCRLLPLSGRKADRRLRTAFQDSPNRRQREHVPMLTARPPGRKCTRLTAGARPSTTAGSASSRPPHQP